MATQSLQQEVSAQAPVSTSVKKQDFSKLITSKEQILAHYPNVFDGIGKFPGHPYSIQLDPSITPKQTPCHPVMVDLKDIFKQEIGKMLMLLGG